MKTKHHTYQFTDRQKEIINGCLLGDGSLTKLRSPSSNCSFYTVHSEKQLGLIEWLFDELSPVSSRIKKRYSDVARLNNSNIEDIRLYYTYNTFVHPYLTQIEEKWYKRNDDGSYCLKKIGNQLHRIKIVPQDLILTPQSIACWYWDDGTNDSGQRSVTFYTDSFTKAECEYLVNQLEKFNIKSYLQKRSGKENVYLIKSRAKSYIDFIDLVKAIGVPTCMKYKISLDKYKERTYNLTEKETVLKIIQLLKDKIPQTEIMKLCNVSEYIVTNIYRGKHYQTVSGFDKLNKSEVPYNNKSGVAGIDERDDGYIVRIRIGKKEPIAIYLGKYDNFPDAIKVRKAAEALRAKGIKNKDQYLSIKPS